MPSFALVLVDAIGAPRRAAMLQSVCKSAGIHFLRICPADIQQPGATPIEIPAHWLPSSGLTARNPYWLRSHYYHVLAARMLPPVDFYWCVEADVCAAPATWARLFQSTKDRTEDGLFTRMYHASEAPGNPWLHAPGLPAWAVWYVHGAILRVSSRALQWFAQVAETTTPFITETILPSIIAHNGGNISRIGNDLYNCQTMPFQVPLLFDPSKINHPCKWDDPEPPLTYPIG